MECVENYSSINELNQNSKEAPNLYTNYLGAAPQVFFCICIFIQAFFSWIKIAPTSIPPRFNTRSQGSHLPVFSLFQSSL